MHRLLAVVVALFSFMVVGAGGVGAQDANPFADLGLPEIAVTITSDSYECVPAELAASRYVLAVTNTLEAPLAEPPETSGAAFLRAPDGMTAADLVEMLGPAEATPEAMAAEASPVAEEGGDEAPPWYHETEMAGGPYVFPGQTGYAVVDLTAGEWILWGESPGDPRAPVPLVVTGEPAADQPAPTAAVTIEMSEFTFTFDPPLAAGQQIVEIANVGVQPHFLFKAQVPDGTTVEDALALFATFEDPAATPAGGLAFEDATEVLSTGDQSAGTTAWYTADFTAGTYLAACFVTDPETGMPHAMLGMTQIVVLA